MGVIRNFNNINHSNTDDDWIYVLSDGEDSEHDDLTKLVSGRRHRNQRAKKLTKPEPTFAALGVKGKSHKKFRRYANAELDEVSINDFIPQTRSSFSLLMTEIDAAFDYNEFINCTEDEQKIMLKEVIDREISKMEQSQNIETSEDYRHCFSRIDPAIRRQLLKKHVPLGILASIEKKVIDHFRNHPKTIYITILKCSYQRFLLHACCQYLNLYCRSSTSNGKRLSHVHNGRLNFVEPSKLLSEYLDLNH